MAIRMAAFSGEAPKIEARLLPDNAAQVAQNVRLQNGALEPLRVGRLEHTFSSPRLTVARLWDGSWYGWPGIVSYARAPIDEKRIYFTGDGAPKFLYGANLVIGLALPGPATPPVVFLGAGDVDPSQSRTIVYAYTYVTGLDEESEPSPLSGEVLWSPGLVVNVNTFAAPPANRQINRIRVYRSETSASGVTNLYLVHERASTNLGNFADNVSQNPIQEVLPSGNWNPPPATLQGLVAMPNGMLAAFAGNKIYFSEPYFPHAWPESYVLTVDYPVVALGVFGQSLAILTEGHPYVASGVAPEVMVMERLRVNLPCLSARGVVDLGYAVAYPSTTGLVTVNNAGAQVSTGNLFSPQQWRALTPASMVAGHHNGRYIATYALAGGGTGLVIIDLSGEQPFLMRGGDTAAAIHTDIGEGTMFLVVGTKLIQWDDDAQPPAEMLWRSKPHHLPGASNFGVLLIEGVDTMTAEERAANKTRWGSKEALAAGVAPIGRPPFWLEPAATGLLDPAAVPPRGFAALVYADGRPVHLVTDMNRPVRLPAGYLAFAWEVEVRGTEKVTTISLASSPTELAG